MEEGRKLKDKRQMDSKKAKFTLGGESINNKVLWRKC
jgi:hypothetical protein